MQTFSDYDEAVAAVPEGMSVCGAYKGPEPVYFFAPADADDVTMRALSFEAVNGRPMGGYESWALGMAMRLRDGKVPA